MDDTSAAWAGDERMSLDVLRTICAQLNLEPEVSDCDLTWIPPEDDASDDEPPIK